MLKCKNGQNHPPLISRIISFKKACPCGGTECGGTEFCFPWLLLKADLNCIILLFFNVTIMINLFTDVNPGLHGLNQPGLDLV